MGPEVILCGKIEKQDHGLGQGKLYERLLDHAGQGDVMIAKDFFDCWPVDFEAASHDAYLIEGHIFMAHQAQDFLCDNRDFIVDAEGVHDFASPLVWQRRIGPLVRLIKEPESGGQIALESPVLY